MTRPSLSISIAAYNEEGTLEALALDSLAVLAKHADDYELVIIDDGSVDRTGPIADQLARDNKHIRVFHHPKNLGFGVTLKEAFTLPTKAWVFFLPGDGQIPPKELEKLLPWRDRADFILGWRVNRQDPWRRKMTAGIYNLFISALLGKRIHDVDSVPLFKRALADRFELQSKSVFLHAELCLQSIRAGARMVEVPIGHKPRLSGEARGNRPGVIIDTFREMLAYTFSKPPVR